VAYRSEVTTMSVVRC